MDPVLSGCLILVFDPHTVQSHLYVGHEVVDWESNPQLVTLVWHDANPGGDDGYEHFQLIRAQEVEGGDATRR